MRPRRYASVQHSDHPSLKISHPTLDLDFEVRWNGTFLEGVTTGADVPTNGVGWYNYGISEISVYDSGDNTVSSPPVETDTPVVYHTAYSQDDDLLFSLGMFNTSELVVFNEIRGGHVRLGSRDASNTTRYQFDMDPDNLTVSLGNLVFKTNITAGAGQDGYSLTWDDTAGNFALTDVSGGGGGGGLDNVVEDTTPQLGGDLDTNSNAINFADDIKLNFGTDTDVSIDFDDPAFDIAGNASAVDEMKIVGIPRLKVTEFTVNGGDDFVFGMQPGATGKRFTFYDYQNSRDGLIWDLDNQTWDFDAAASVTLGNMTFNTDQSIGAGQDNYVLTYDHSSGEIGLEAAAGGGGGAPTENVIFTGTKTSGQNINGTEGTETDLTWDVVSQDTGEITSFSSGGSQIDFTNAGWVNIHASAWITNGVVNNRSMWGFSLYHYDSGDTLKYSYHGDVQYNRDDSAAYDSSGGHVNQNMMYVEADDYIILRFRVLDDGTSGTSQTLDTTYSKIRIARIEF